MAGVIALALRTVWAAIAGLCSLIQSLPSDQQYMQ